MENNAAQQSHTTTILTVCEPVVLVQRDHEGLDYIYPGDSVEIERGAGMYLYLVRVDDGARSADMNPDEISEYTVLLEVED